MDPFQGWIDRAGREPASFPAIVVLAEGQRIAVTITNISSAGCQIDCAETLSIGQAVRIELAGDIAAHASVRWAISGHAGLRFSVASSTVDPPNGQVI